MKMLNWNTFDQFSKIYKKTFEDDQCKDTQEDVCCYAVICNSKKRKKKEMEIIYGSQSQGIMEGNRINSDSSS